MKINNESALRGKLIGGNGVGEQRGGIVANGTGGGGGEIEEKKHKGQLREKREEEIERGRR